MTMQVNPLISVMILTYNQAKYVRQSVEGALLQECSYPFEIVICDDCSTDNTREVCIELQKKYPEKIRLIFNENNKGPIDNYIDTMRKCKGKYIADCAGDDYWIDSTKLQKQVDILERREDVILVYTNWKDLISRTGEILGDSKSGKGNFKKELLTKDDLPVYLNQKGYSIVNINTSCFRKDDTLDIVDRYNYFFDKEKYPCEDFQLLFLMLSEGSFYYIDEEMGVYRNNENSVSRSQDFSKYFLHQYRKTTLRMELSRDFNININQYLSIQSHLLMSLALKAKNSHYARMTKDLIDAFGYSWSRKTQLLYVIASNKILTIPAYQLYLLLRKMKSFIKN